MNMDFVFHLIIKLKHLMQKKDTKYKCVMPMGIHVACFCTSLFMVQSTFIVLSCLTLAIQQCIWFYENLFVLSKSFSEIKFDG
jgi:hypothetical protein